MMEWDKSRRYKAVGYISNSKEGLILVFDLQEAIMFSEQPEEYFDKRTGKTKKRRFVYYPEMYAGHIGKTYSDYIAGEQMNLFEDLSSYNEQGMPILPDAVTGSLSKSNAPNDTPPLLSNNIASNA